MEIKVIPFNTFQVNTYFIFDKAKNLIVVDPGCSSHKEREDIQHFIKSQNLTLRYIFLTHGHIDHVIGAGFLQQTFQAPIVAHPEITQFLENMTDWAALFGFEQPIQPKIDIYVEDESTLKLQNEQFRILYTPGHADGSICLVLDGEKFVVVGDLLFRESIGRTDLPTGDFHTLIQSIKNKIYTLDDDYTIYPGHGPSTTIAHEKKFNPFLRA